MNEATTIQNTTPLEPVRIFIGSEIGNEKAEKALHWSIINTSSGPVEVNWMNDKYKGSIWDGWNKRREHRKQDTGEGWKTNFSAFRWAIPELCNFNGRAIYLDVDQIVLKDIRQMWSLRFGQSAALAINLFRTDVMLMKCKRFNADWWPRIEKMKPSGKVQASYRRVAYNKGKIGKLDPIYNCLDGEFWDPNKTRLVHYTEMSTQPWRPFPENMEYKPHPVPELELLWNQHYAAALEFEKTHNIKLGSPDPSNSSPIIVGNIISRVADYQNK